MRDESFYRDQVNGIVSWCDENDLCLNVQKTKEMIVDFRIKKDPLSPLLINGTVVDQVDSFKFLGTHVSNNLSWSVNCQEILKKARQRLFFLRKLRSFGVSKAILVNFYRAIIESVLTFSICIWYGSATQADLRKLTSVVGTAEKIIGTSLPSLESIYINRMEKKTLKIMSDPCHPAFEYFKLLPSGRTLRTFKGCRRLTTSFFPSAVKHYNSSKR